MKYKERKHMIKINKENSKALLLAAQEIFDTTGQLWVTIDGDEIYIPELIKQLKQLHKHDSYND